MANISIALENKGSDAKWRFLNIDQDDIPSHPYGLEPIARIEV
jgi:hypothetical protein